MVVDLLDACSMLNVRSFPISEPAGIIKHLRVKAGTCARDRRVLQQLVLNVHVKHSDLT